MDDVTDQLSTQPLMEEDAQALKERGNALLASKRAEEALAIYDRALALQPDYIAALYNRGLALLQLKRAGEALSSFDRVLALAPDDAEALTERGNALLDLKRAGDALASYDSALALKSDYVAALYGRGLALVDLGRLQDALSAYDRALALQPDFAEALYSRGILLSRLERSEEALASYDQVLTLEPQHASALIERGNVLSKLSRYEEALASYDRVLVSKPEDIAALNNRGNALSNLKRYEEALSSYDRVLLLGPNRAEALNNRGSALLNLQQYEDALVSFDRALEIKPDYAEALNNRGNVLQQLGRYEEAVASYDRAVALNPDYASAHYNESLCRLRMGDFAEGWRQQEWRWRDEQFDSPKRDFAQPLWLGESAIAGKTVLLHAEQGLGDTVQFCRYAKLVAAKGATVLLEVPPALEPLLAQLDGVNQLLRKGEPLPAFDYHCPLLSLPLAFNTRLDNIPADIPYLYSDPARVGQWQAKLGPETVSRIGLMWAGNAAHKNDHNRSIALLEFVTLVSGQAQFVSLQKELRPGDDKILSQRPQLHHFGDELNDLADTAALIDLMDVVITVDTSIAHIAGAMGKAVWILLPFNPDWRWLLEREDSPWYPTARLFRQPAIGEWSSVLQRVSHELKEQFL